ncbi:putative gustatory receptor 98b [Drosophila ficusphila]|uniref:putative gustatory receptor 98b n=1 Tax=Drosophila ficusphila TaxID=30025 RepID=UPI0007E78A09|nr:putative gustatory receptor 98b [Drosophila ficusphila]
MVAKKSRLLTAAFPYLQIFSIFALTPPPQSFGKTSYNRLRWYLMAGYFCYAAAMLALVFTVTYINIMAINEEVLDYNVADFTRVMGSFQKGLISVTALANQINMLFNYHRIGRIYEDVADLEKDIEKASQCYGGQYQRYSFRFRLLITVGVWLVLMVFLMPRFTYSAMGHYVSWPNKIITEFVIVMLQLKAMEYCVFVLLIHELILHLRRTLLQLQEELEDCNQKDMLQALCVALKRNQLLLGRVWKLQGEMCSYFTLPMMILFVYNGLTILHVVNWAYINTFLQNDCCRYDRFGTVLLLILNILFVCLLSQRCINSYNSFPRILHQIRCLSSSSDFPLLTRGLREYSLQLQHLKLLFTCGAFFDINLKCFGGMLVTIMGYIIILLQFKVQGIAETNYKSARNISVSQIQN